MYLSIIIFFILKNFKILTFVSYSLFINFNKFKPTFFIINLFKFDYGYFFIVYQVCVTITIF